jgi:hypothetical protein
VFNYFEGTCGIFECIGHVPYEGVPVALIFLAILVEWIEKRWHRSRP